MNCSAGCSVCGYENLLPGATMCQNCLSEKKGGGQILRMEKWQSSEARQEVHYFIEGTQTYVMGFNPALVPDDVAIRALKNLGYKV